MSFRRGKALYSVGGEAKGLSLDAPGREALERALIDSLSHLAVHSGVLDERLDEVLVDQANPEELDEIIDELKAWWASP